MAYNHNAGTSQPEREELEGVMREMSERISKVNSEIFENAPIKDGLPQVSAQKISDVLNKYGFKSATNRECL